jgi:hypothetical protein
VQAAKKCFERRGSRGSRVWAFTLENEEFLSVALHRPA